MIEMAHEESQQGQDSQPAIGMNGLPKSHQPDDASESQYNGEAAPLACIPNEILLGNPSLPWRFPHNADTTMGRLLP